MTNIHSSINGRIVSRLFDKNTVESLFSNKDNNINDNNINDNNINDNINDSNNDNINDSDNDIIQCKKRRRVTEKYFKSWVQTMNHIYENKSISIDDMFHLFLIQMKFESKKILKINFNLCRLFGNISKLDIILKKKFRSNKKLIRELIPIITIDYKNSNYDFIESSISELYIDKINNIIYKEFDLFSLLDMIQEAFIQKILYSYLPNNIAQIYGIYKNNNIQQVGGEKDIKYIYTQTYFKDGTLYSNYSNLNKKQLLNILISLCNQLNTLQKEVQFLHNDLKINNICINIDKEETHLIDFGYSSLVFNNTLIHGFLKLELSEFNKITEFNKNNSFIQFTKDKDITHEDIINNKYRNSTDLFYLIYTILYYNNSQFKNPLYDILYDLFDVNDSIKGKINIFDKLYSLESSSFEHAGFFMTKSHELFIQYFGNNIENIDTFYEKFLPENLNDYLTTFVQNN